LHRLEEDAPSGQPLATAQLDELREMVVNRGLALATETSLSVWAGRIMNRDRHEGLNTPESRLETMTVDGLATLLQWYGREQSTDGL